MNNGFASVYTTSLRDSKIINLPTKVKASQIGLFDISKKSNYQFPIVYAAKLATNLNAQRLGSHGGILKYEVSPNIFEKIHTYNAAHITQYPPDQDEFVSRLELTYCTRLGDTHFLFSLGSREIYLLDVSKNQIAKLADGYSPLVYIPN